MKKILLILFLLPMAVWAKPRTYGEILKSKELRICYPLWLSKDTLADYPSPFMEMAVSFAKGKKLKPVLKQILWNEQFANAEGKIQQNETYTPALFDSQKCDMYASNISPLEWRKKLMELNWIYISSLTIVVRKDEKKKYRSVEDLKGKTVYVTPNTTYHVWLLEYQNTLKDSEKMKIVEAPDGGTVGFLLKKDSDFIIFESQNALYSKAHISPDLAVAFKVGKAEESGWGFPKGSEDFRNETVKFFDEGKKSPDSEINQIYKKYFGMTLNDYEKLQYSLIQ